MQPEDDLTREWRERLQRWARSGVGGSTFAQQEGVTPSTLYRWSDRLGVGPERQRGRPRKGSATKLLPVIVTEARTEVVMSPPPLELALPGGVLVRVPRGFDAETLTRLVHALGGH